jgi:hypothetical protein
VSEEAGRLVDRVHDRGHVLELTLDRVFDSIATLAATTAVERVDANAIDEGGDDTPEAPVRARRAVDEDERRALATRRYPIRVPSLDLTCSRTAVASATCRHYNAALIRMLYSR